MIPFAEWTPDRPDLNNPGATVALNVVPIAGGYEPFQSGVVITDALDDRCQGAIGIKQVDGDTFNFAGDATKLYELKANLWVDVKAITYTISQFDQWKFTQFGSLVIAANGSDSLQKIRAGTDSDFTQITTTNAPVGAKFITVVKDFVVVGPVTISNEVNVQWSARGDATAWVDGVNSAGAQPLFEGGPVQGLTGGDFGTILQESAITRMTFVGGDLVFTFDVIENARGCIAPGSIVQLGAITYYWSEEGVEAFTGNRGINIGEGKVNTTLLKRLDQESLEEVTATIDPQRRLVLWSYLDIDGTKRLLIYNVGQNQFSDIELDIQVLISSRDIKISIDDITGSIDASPLTGFPGVFSLDDVALAGVRRILSAFNTSNQMMNLNGDNLAATLTTGELVLSAGGSFISDNKKINTRRLRGAIDGTHTLTIKHRKKLQNNTTDTTASVQDDGSSPIRVNDRYQRFQMNTLAAATWTFAQGIDLEELTKDGR